MTERGAQRRIKEQYGCSVRLCSIGVGDFNASRKQWPIYVTGEFCNAPSIYWIT